MRIKSKLLITLALSSSLFINTPLLAKSKHNDLSASLASTSLGFSYIKAGNGAKAKQEFIKAIRQAEDNDAAWYGLAYYYEATGHKQLAEKYYKQAIKINSLSGIPNNNYGTFLCRQKRPKEAIRQFLIAANNPRYLNTAGAYENAGLCALLIPNKKLAALYFHNALRNNPHSETSLLELAKIDYQKGRIAEAKSLYQRYLKAAKTTNMEAEQLADKLYNNRPRPPI